MRAMVPQIIGVSFVYLTVYSGIDQRKHQISASLTLWGEFTGDGRIPRTKASDVEMFPFDDVFRMKGNTIK